MSRIGKQIITIPESVEISLDSGVLRVKGAKGSLERKLKDAISININGKEITLTPKEENDKKTNALWGTYASHIKNMILGVTEGFTKKLILDGVGFKSEVSGDKLVLALGFSHPVKLAIPKGLTVTADKNNITITGIDKELVGSFTAFVRSNKKPEPYKGKGFRYEDEVIRRKQGKKAS